MDHVGKLKASNSDLTTIDYDMDRTLSGVEGGQNFTSAACRECWRGPVMSTLAWRKRSSKSAGKCARRGTPALRAPTKAPHAPKVVTASLCAAGAPASMARGAPGFMYVQGLHGLPGPQSLVPCTLQLSISPQRAKLLSCLERGWLFAFGNAATRRGHTRASRSLHRRSRQVARLPTAAVVCRCCSSTACSQSQTLPYNMPLTL